MAFDARTQVVYTMCSRQQLQRIPGRHVRADRSALLVEQRSQTDNGTSDIDREAAGR